MPSVDIFERSIIKEFNELGPLKEIAQEFGLQDINIIFQGKAFNKTFLVKKLLKAHSIGELSKMQKVLTLAQEKSLENDIYALAVTVKKKLNLDLDIKAENLAWDPSKKRFVMYGLSVRNSGGFLYPEGFKGYLDYFTNRFNTLSLQRKPSSLLANSIKMCSDNSLGIPSEFKKEYESKIAGYKFNFKSLSIDLNDVDLSGCFKVSDISYQGSHQQINFLLFSDKSSLEFIEFAIHKDVSTKEASFGFTINNNGEIANSIEDGVVEK